MIYFNNMDSHLSDVEGVDEAIEVDSQVDMEINCGIDVRDYVNSVGDITGDRNLPTLAFNNTTETSEQSPARLALNEFPSSRSKYAKETSYGRSEPRWTSGDDDYECDDQEHITVSHRTLGSRKDQVCDSDSSPNEAYSNTMGGRQQTVLERTDSVFDKQNVRQWQRESRSRSLDLIDIHFNNEGQFGRDAVIDSPSGSGRMLVDAVDSREIGGRQFGLSFDRNSGDYDDMHVGKSVVNKNHNADIGTACQC